MGFCRQHETRPVSNYFEGKTAREELDMAKLEVVFERPVPSMPIESLKLRRRVSFLFFSVPSCINAARLHEMNWKFIELENIQCCHRSSIQKHFD